MGENFDLQNISDPNGIAKALTGKQIVFTALILLSIFIALLPRIVPQTETAVRETAPRDTTPESEELSVVAALGYALYLRERPPDQKS